MNHLTSDELLLLAYGEVPPDRAVEFESHLSHCPACRERLVAFDQARVALDIAVPARRTTVLHLVGVALAAAALVAGLVITRAEPSRPKGQAWSPTTSWSATAGYVTGGKAMIDIDAQLTRLEQERYYGLPN